MQDGNEKRQAEDDYDAKDGGEGYRGGDVVAVGADHRRDSRDRRVAADRIAAGDQDGKAQRQAERAADRVARPDRHRDYAGDAEDQHRPEREEGGSAHRGAEHDDRDFEQGLGAEADAGVPARSRLPCGAQGDANEDREHEGLEIGLAGEADFDSVYRIAATVMAMHRATPWQKLSQLIDQMQSPGAKSRGVRLAIRSPIVNAPTTGRGARECDNAGVHEREVGGDG